MLSKGRNGNGKTLLQPLLKRSLKYATKNSDIIPTRNRLLWFTRLITYEVTYSSGCRYSFCVDFSLYLKLKLIL